MVDPSHEVQVMLLVELQVRWTASRHPRMYKKNSKTFKEAHHFLVDNFLQLFIHPTVQVFDKEMNHEDTPLHRCGNPNSHPIVEWT